MGRLPWCMVLLSGIAFTVSAFVSDSGLCCPLPTIDLAELLGSQSGNKCMNSMPDCMDLCNADPNDPNNGKGRCENFMRYSQVCTTVGNPCVGTVSGNACGNTLKYGSPPYTVCFCAGGQLDVNWICPNAISTCIPPNP